MLSKNGTLNGVIYNNGDKYGSYEAYTYFDGAYPLGTRNLGISVSGITGTTPTQRGAAFTLEGRRLVKVTGRVNTSSATMYVALYTASGTSISSPQSITSTSGATVLFSFGSGITTSVCIRAWMSSSSSSQMGTITAVTVETFAPNFAIDGLTGKTIQINSVVKGTIKAQLFYGATSGEISGNYEIDLENNPYYTYICSCTGDYITLPSAVEYDGVELRFHTKRFATRSYYSPELLSTDGIGYPSGNYWVSSQRVQLGPNQIVTVKAILGTWYVLSGAVSAT
ncbi:MAG: hypothetical protein IJ647_02490 [Prevotella sp.]|nr:hypothetical protein [Prevotella sp.]